jgi:hypothetical protein
MTTPLSSIISHMADHPNDRFIVTQKSHEKFDGEDLYKLAGFSSQIRLRDAKVTYFDVITYTTHRLLCEKFGVFECPRDYTKEHWAKLGKFKL